MLETECQKTINTIPALIEKTFPIPAKFRSKLPSDIAELSRLLTNKRGDRSLSYLARPNFLSAYLYYFLPWNLFRLCLLIPTLNIKLSANDSITDFGCGPLTFVSALWIARADLRNVPLEINCIDRSSQAMEAGK
ncbi:MAG: rRNA methyltransferase, partial [Treponema sp.]|nr:rRNA methyltransferase [Treponema sp.]